MLIIKDLESGYGKVNVLKKINIEVPKNKVVRRTTDVSDGESNYVESGYYTA